jgi:hypothetical protein
MLRTIWLCLQDLFGFSRDGLDPESSSDSGHGVDPNG